MALRGAPLALRDIEPLLVSDADAFTTLRYLRQREAVPALQAMEGEGQRLPGIEGALADLYHSLWAIEPGLKAEVPADRRYWQTMLGQALKSGGYQELHASTQLKELPSILGTVAMGESVLKLVPKEDGKKLRELQQAQQEADQHCQDASAAQAMAEALQAMLDSASGQPDGDGTPSGEGNQQSGSGGQPGGKPSGSPSSGRPQGPGQGGMTPEQASQIANRLAAIQAQATAAQTQAEAAKAKAEQMANDLLGKPGSQEAEQKIRELTRIGLQAIKDAQVKVEEISETIAAWGLEEAELTRQPLPEALALLERMKKNADFKKFAALLGRLRQIAMKKAHSKIKGEGQKVATVEYGRDIRRALPRELAALSNSAMRVQTLQRWVRGELALRGQKTRQKLGHGPVVACEDGSGSMGEEKARWARGTSLALADFARLQRRGFGWILFDSSVRAVKVFPNGQISPVEKLAIAEARAGGGTDFARPLDRARQVITETGLRKADICFITDGICQVNEVWLNDFLAWKKAAEVSVLVVLCDVGEVTDASVTAFADRVVKVSAFTADEAEMKIFSHL